MHEKLSQKADVEDLQKKLDIEPFHEFKEATAGNISGLQQEVQQAREYTNSVVGAVDDKLKALETTEKEKEAARQQRFQHVDERLAHLEAEANKDPAAAARELTGELRSQMLDHVDNIVEMLRGEMANLGAPQGQMPAFGSMGGAGGASCFSCGRPTGGAFSPMPSRAPVSPNASRIFKHMKRSKSEGASGKRPKSSQRRKRMKNSQSMISEGGFLSDGDMADTEREPLKLPPIEA